FFFFQAEDGIRDFHVTGVQTCALPIFFLTLIVCTMWHLSSAQSVSQVIAHRGAWKIDGLPQNSIASLHRAIELGCAGSEFDVHRSEERRVGKECRARRSTCRVREKKSR